MSKSQKTIVYIITTAILTLGSKAFSSTFHCDGKEMSKGQVIKILATNNKAKCTKTDDIEFNDEKGTIKNKKAVK